MQAPLWLRQHQNHPQAHPQTPDTRDNPGFSVPKEVFKWNNWTYVDKLDRIHRWNVGQRAPPYKMIIIPSNRCNLKCPYCPNSYARTVGRFKARDELTDDQWLGVVREALDFGVKEFYVLGGGEPLLRKSMLLRIYQMIKDADPENITELITNAYFFAPEDIDLIVSRKLINKVLFSVDGHSPEIHDYVRGVPGSWKRAIEALKLFNKLKREYRSDKPVLHMNHIITNKSYAHICETVELCKQLGVTELALHPMREYEETQGSVEHLKLTGEEERLTHRELGRAQKLAAGSQVYLNVSMVEETKAKEGSAREEFLVGKEFLRESSPSGKPVQHFKTFCYEPLYSIFIDPKGNANYCCTAGDSENSQNVVNRGLRAVWYGNYLMGVRGTMLAGGKTPKCFNCGLYDMTHDLKYDMRKYVDYVMKIGHYREEGDLPQPPEKPFYCYTDNIVSVRRD